MENSKPKRIRKPNFTADEIANLLEEIAQEKTLLLSSLTNDNTNKKKLEKWGHIAQKISNCGVAVRSVDELRDKWKNLKSETLRRIEDQKKTGGGPHKKPAPFEDLVLAILGEKSAVVNGISASVPDVFATSRWGNSQPEIKFIIESDGLDSSTALMIQPQVSAITDQHTELDGAADQLYRQATIPEGNNIHIIHLEESGNKKPINGALSQTAQLDKAQLDGMKSVADPAPQLTSTPRRPLQKRKRRFRVKEEKQYFQSQIELNKAWCNVLPAFGSFLPVMGSYLERQQRIADLQERVLSLQARKLELEIEEKDGGFGASDDEDDGHMMMNDGGFGANDDEDDGHMMMNGSLSSSTQGTSSCAWATKTANTGGLLHTGTVPASKAASEEKQKSVASVPQQSVTMTEKSIESSAARQCSANSAGSSHTVSSSHLSNRKRNYDELVKMDMVKLSDDVANLKKNEDDEAAKNAHRKIALQRERLKLRKERALMDIEIEKEKVNLEHQKVKLELDKVELEKRKIELQQMCSTSEAK